MYVVIGVIFFFAVNACNKKIVQSCIFFCGKSCKPVTRITAKKKLHDLTIFFVRAFTAKKNYTTYRKEIANFTENVCL